MSRTDIHAPSSESFDPAAYTCWGCYDNSPEPFFGPDLGLKEYREQVKNLLRDGYRPGRGGFCVCGHCGASIRYFALLVRDDVKEFIHVGEQCLDNRFDLAAEEFQALRKAAKLNRERANRDERIAALVQENQSVAWLVENGSDVQTSEFLSDVRQKFLDNGRLSPGQVGAVERAKAGIERRKQWAAERAAKSAALVAAGVRAPEGRVEVEGEIVSARVQQSDFGDNVKIVVKTDAGWACWLTLPSSLGDSLRDDNGNHLYSLSETADAVKGKRVRLTATLTRSPSDQTFAFGKRPAKASFISA